MVLVSVDVLNCAQRNRVDEFYTRLETVEAELGFYGDCFRGKSVFLPCDDPFRSVFFRFFVTNFVRLGLRELVFACSSAAPVGVGGVAGRVRVVPETVAGGAGMIRLFRRF